MEEKRLLTIGIPCGPHAYETLKRLYCSIIIQTQVDKVKVMLCLDGPECNKKDFTEVVNQFKEIPTDIVRTEVNLGPGGACDKIIEECDTPLLTFMDADDTWYDELAVEILMSNVKETTVLVESIFAGEMNFEECIKAKGQIPRLRPYKNHGFSPWRFGRVFNAEFLKKNGIKSTNLRTMEDSCLVKQVHLLAEGSPFTIEAIENLTYVWKEQPKSITRSGVDTNEKKEPYYNRYICPTGAVLSSINAVRNVKKKNPFNSNLSRHITDMMVNSYFSYIENSERDPRSADINLFNALLMYHEGYKDIEKDISDDILNEIYSQHMVSSAQSLIGIVPKYTFPQFMEMVRQAPYGGNEQYKDIISQFPQDCIDKCVYSGVLDPKEGVSQWILPANDGELLHPTCNWEEYKKVVESTTGEQ